MELFTIALWGKEINIMAFQQVRATQDAVRFSWTDKKAGLEVEVVFEVLEEFPYEDSVIKSIIATVNGTLTSINQPAHLQFLVGKANLVRGQKFKIVYGGKQKRKGKDGKSYNAHQFELLIDDGDVAIVVDLGNSKK